MNEVLTFVTHIRIKKIIVSFSFQPICLQEVLHLYLEPFLDFLLFSAIYMGLRH